MFETVRLVNFRAFRDTGELRLRRLNVIIGQNSSGKSSILHALVLLKQTLDDPEPRTALVTAGGPQGIDLGGYPDLVHGRRERLVPEIHFRLAAALAPRITVEEEPGGPGVPAGHVPAELRLAFSQRARTGAILVRRFEALLADGSAFVRGAPRGRPVVRDWESDVIPETDRGHFALALDHFVPMLAPIGRAPKSPRALARAQHWLGASWGLRFWVSETFQRTAYLGPLREYVRRMYPVTGESPSTVGARGENMIAVLHRDENLRPAERRGLLGHMAAWLRDEFGLVEDIVLQQMSTDGQPAMLSLVARDAATGDRINLADAGFGVSQVAPVVTQGFLSRQATALLIEQPEIHLHPRAQAALGSLLVELANSGRQLLVETHSEHLVLRIRRHVAEGKIRPPDVGLFYVERGTRGSTVRALELDAQGMVPDWPKGFFEEDYAEAMQLARAASGV